MSGLSACIDGNEAAARVSYALSDVIAIYPITPSSSMGEMADTWSAAGRPNLWGSIPEVVEMQSESGAAGALHGAATKGALATTYTASQGLLLMIPNMYKLAGELTPAVIHVASRAVAAHALSIFGDHSDVMAARTTGFALLCSSSVQEAHDLALVAHAASLRSRIPFLHFFDGFRTSHEVNKIRLLSSEDMAAVVDEADVLAQRQRGLSPDHPVVRGTAQNPDVFFQSREAANPFYAAVPGVVDDALAALAARTGRRYGLVDYVGAPDAERVLVVMGAGAGAAEEAVDALTAAGERVGLVKVRLYRPFPVSALLRSLPSTVRAVAVLDRVKEASAIGEPLYQDVLTAIAEGVAAGDAPWASLPLLIGGRYGLSSKELTPAMAKAVFDELDQSQPKRHFTVGITDDVTHTSLGYDPTFLTPFDGKQAVFYGLGSDGTVSTNKASVKIVGDGMDLFAQGYFVYDSKKAGAITVSHLRFSPSPIRSSYLVQQADFVACHQFSFLARADVLQLARPGATVLLNSPYGADQVWHELPVETQRQIIDKHLDVWVVDASAVARDLGLGRHVNTILQTCFFRLFGMLPHEQATDAIKRFIEQRYAKKGHAVVERNWEAVDRALEKLQRVTVPDLVDEDHRRRWSVSDAAPEFVRTVTARLLAGEGDMLPVSALPADGVFPSGTSRWEKRSLAVEIPIWEPRLCIDCGKCTIVCPHAAIRMKACDPADVDGAPEQLPRKNFRSRDLPGKLLVLQVSPDDCTGCGVCVEACPAHDKGDPSRRAITMQPVEEHRRQERENWEAFTAIPELDRRLVAPTTVKTSQLLQPLFEFSGACAGCGETPYLKLLTQLFGDRVLIANATGCSSIYGGNLPTTPWTTDGAGRGPAWSNSLFEDNAEFGLGMLLALEHQVETARRLVRSLAPTIGPELARGLLEAEQDDEQAIAAQRERVARLKETLTVLRSGPFEDDARRLSSVADELVRKSVWIVGGDGWAYDIGAAGLDHVLGSGRNVNVLVLDTEVYSNTGGQASKATPRGATARFAVAGKPTRKKNLALQAMSYANVYVAQVALGGSDIQTVKALSEAAAWSGPSLVIAYASCVSEHGFEESRSMVQQRLAVRSGHWPLFRYNPGATAPKRPFELDSHRPSLSLQELARFEARFAQLAHPDTERWSELLKVAQADIDSRWRLYEELAARGQASDGAENHDGEAANMNELATSVRGER